MPLGGWAEGRGTVLSGDRLTREEASSRAARLTDVRYQVALEIGEEEEYRGEATVRFSAQGGEDLFLDFRGGRVDALVVNGREGVARWAGGRIVVPGGALGGPTEVRVAYSTPFDTTGEGFHRFVDPQDGAVYVYTQFEPFLAHRVFPCFDQPDVKAPYRLTVTAPAGWEVVSNGPEEGREAVGVSRVRRRFGLTQPFSPYLVAVVAGPLHRVEGRHGPTPLGLWCRRSLAEHLDPQELFAITARGMDFFGEFFGTLYPFGKYDQLFVPEFNWGGMENVGAVTYSDEHFIFRDPPAYTERLRRAEVLLHELAHMWFGNLVTMRWWDDLWLNESFASYMAYLAIDQATGLEGAWQSFLARMKVWAYHEDELPTTHRIADEVPTTEETFLNFDAITYGKGAAAIKQLVARVGMDGFREGMRRYFGRHAFANAELSDFLAALEEGSGLDLEAWAKAWLETAGLNTLEVERAQDRLTIVQGAPPEHPTLRPHRLEVALVGPVGEVRAVPLLLEGASAELEDRAALVFPNHGDHTYAKALLDQASLAFVREHLGGLGPPLLRQLLWVALWSMVRDRRLASPAFLELVRRHLPGEPDLQVLQMVIALGVGDFSARAVAPPILDHYLPEGRREEEAHRFVEAAREALEGARGDARRLWVRGLIGQAIRPGDLELAARLVEGEDADQPMRWEVAVRWAAHGMPGAEERLAAEAERDPSDEGRRALVRAEASRPDPPAKREAWERIHARRYPSLQTARAAMAGFRWPHQRRLLEPYALEFFERLPEVFDEWDRESAKRYFLELFPHYRPDREVLERARAALAGTGDRPMLRRLLVEAIDRVERALACRDFAARHGD